MILDQNLSNLPGSTDGPGLNFLEKDSCNSTSVTKDLQSIDMFEHNFFDLSNFEFRNFRLFFECRIFRNFEHTFVTGNCCSYSDSADHAY